MKPRLKLKREKIDSDGVQGHVDFYGRVPVRWRLRPTDGRRISRRERLRVMRSLPPKTEGKP